MNKKNISIIILILLISWIGLIFYFSSQPSRISYKQSDVVTSVIEKADDLFGIKDTKVFKGAETLLRDKLLRGKYKSTSAVIRKSAHLAIYLILGVICSSLAYIYSKNIFMTFILGVSIPLIVAVFDEINQSFVGRTSSVEDILLDGTGALIGTVLVIIVIILINTITYIWKDK